VTPDDARDRLRERYTVMRSDPFVIDAGLWLALVDLAHTIRDTYTTRVAWENASDGRAAAELEQAHRRVHGDLIAKLDAAASAAEHHDGPESAPEASPLVSGPAAINQPPGAHGESAGGIPQPTLDADRTGGAL
jgi:hypothetical protein